MKNKKESGMTSMDIISGIIIFMISTTVVLSLYYQIYITTAEIKIHQAAIGYITEIFEKIDLESYENVTKEKVESMIKETKMDEYFSKEKNDSTIECSLINYHDASGVSKDLVKKINITVTYTVAGNTTKLPMNKIKVRE